MRRSTHRPSNGQRCALHLDGFDETTLKATLALFEPGSIFDRDAPGNPYRDHSFAFIPYCTGDFHSGDREAEYGIHHVGYRNMGLYLERLVPTFCGASDVTLVGSSAGGFGTVFNYDRVRQAFAPRRVDLVDDAGPSTSPTTYISSTTSRRPSRWDRRCKPG